MIVIENNSLKVTIAQDDAEVREVIHKQNEISYMWTGDSAYWGRVSPVLFPIVGRLKEDQYQVKGESYSMSQHGFLRDVTFEVDKQEKDSASFTFQSACRFTDIYPYEFKATIHYKLKEDSLLVQWEITNENKGDMYFSIGAHPAFRIPLLEEENLEDYHVKLVPAENKNVLEYGIKDSLIHKKGTAHDYERIPLQASLFENDALIYSNIDRVTLESSKSNRGIEVTLKDFPFVGIWSKYDEQNGTIAPFVCIEPWHGIADMHDTSGNLKDKFGINKLGAGEIFQAEYGMRFK
ncbi:aldose epimerase [Virgibacillus profundi]|uniref:Aldose epimerase n=1 Tax=Virgibacillus profundi TaxID=2024555 RepID=A0A2A2IIP4_9BACI|nr:aldose 1-epimerase family protein [Virgibacillus profundi]PAV31134.1 aldose epimerase [Virgibacillus profundi]PXY55317.1 aldose 1-epimerase family protein [Virgibacillus profundi]